MKGAKNKKTNIYHYEVNDVVPEIVVQGIGNLTIKHLFFCFYFRFWKPVFRFLPFLSSKKKKKKKKKRKEIINLPLF